MATSKEIDAQALGTRLNEFTSVCLEVIDVIWESEKYVKLSDRFYYTVFMKIQMILDATFL